MLSQLPYDSEYERAMLTITGNESHALTLQSKVLRARAAEAVRMSQQLRIRCVALTARVSTVLRKPER